MKVLRILVLIIGFTVWGNAQSTVLTGTIYDAYGAVIVKSKITAVNQKGEKFEAIVNDEGFYKLKLPYNEYKPTRDFRIAKYDITVESGLPGFEKVTLKDFKIVGAYNSQMNLDFALDVFVNVNRITVPTKNKNIKRKNNNE